MAVKYVEDNFTVGAVRVRELYCHKHGLMQTASGYGRKLASRYMVKIGTRWHRVYVMCLGNNGSAYICKGGQRFVIRDEDCIREASE